jgi:hypothetical protein
LKNLLSGAQKTVVTSSNNLEREVGIRNCMILRCSKLNWVLNMVFKKHQQQKVMSWSRSTESAILNSNPTPAFVAIPSCEENVKPSNGHQIDMDAAKAAAVATNKSDWS